MRITVLTVPDCPNAPVVRERITAALEGRATEVNLVEVRDEAEAVRWGMTGSPTVLLDGVDPFAVAGAVPGIACRLYRGGDGHVDGAPSVEALRQVLVGADLLGEECCEAESPDPVGRDGRGRLAPAERGLRALQQAVLRHFAATGSAPDPTVLEPTATTAGRSADEVLDELAREDFLTLDDAGRVQAAYPFSAVPTRHRVLLVSGVRVWSMCAIDALGISAMLGQDVAISSSDPVTGEAVTVTFEEGATLWRPTSTVVFVGQRACSGPAAAVCCDVLNFFTSRASARTWSEQHPEVNGEIVGQDRAVEIGRQTFGPLLTEG